MSGTAQRPTRDPQPTVEEQQRLGRLVILYLAKKESSVRRPVLTFLFDELARMGDQREVIKPIHVLEGLELEVTAEGEANIRATMSRLNAAFDNFFNEREEGRREKWRTYLEHGDYCPRFRINDPPPRQNDYLSDLWACYRLSKNPTRLLYPEPQFFIDPEDTYLRNPEANGPNDNQRFAYLTADWQRLKTTHSFVSSGIVTAMLTIISCFHRWNQEIIAQPIYPMDDSAPETHDNLIVLGTPTNNKMIAHLEQSLPMRTGPKEIKIATGRIVEDSAAEYAEHHAHTSRKWGTMTRRLHRYNDRYATVLSARHGRTVDAMAQFLTTPSELPALVDALGRPTKFPESFQALFCVEMTETLTGLRAQNISLDTAMIATNPKGATN